MIRSTDGLFLPGITLDPEACIFQPAAGKSFLLPQPGGVLASGAVDSSISTNAVRNYLFSVALTPPETMYTGIQAVPPARVITIDEHGLAKENIYWKINQIKENRERSFEDFSEEVRSLMIDAVICRAVAGGKIGSIVSGGVDTSVVTSILSDSFGNDRKLPVFSIAFDEKKFSDESLQATMYESFPLAPHQDVIRAEDYWSILKQALTHLDSPVNDDAVVGMFRVFQLTREHGCTAVFEGEGADEIFFTNHVHSERQIQLF